MVWRWFAALCYAVFHEETGQKYDKDCERKLTYCFITCNLNQLPKLLYDNKDTAPVYFNYFYVKSLLPCTKSINYHATYAPRDMVYNMCPILSQCHSIRL